ncbi:hypothetical protein P154DRAFT_623525 [Amniculicola lignicola CBS 123094]|uniref:Cyanovirin-N domain-containing protein n=1 Tax=Amniculicola lignicola CBS 123094 TaxID=1392246 RepID=A0A6A5W7E0_9PLEO|nr:hypothetical protein P154DRAFT_623525 [Amniculicola lignicola CBS 123094]
MKYCSFISALSLFFSLSTAAPLTSSQPAVVGKSIRENCINLEIRNSWLFAECLTGEDSTTRIQSGVGIYNKFGNDDGVLKHSGPIMEVGPALVMTANSSTTHHSKEHIKVYNGHLLSDTFATPNPPITPSKYPVPKDPTFLFGGKTSCADQSTDRDFCRTNVDSCTNSTRNDRREGWWTSESPYHCYVPFIYFPDIHFEFEAFKVMSEGDWNVIGYRDEACKEKIQRVYPEDTGICKVFGDRDEQRVRAFTIVPAFNGDPW